MLEGKRVILKRGVAIRHGWMARIARLGKKAKVSQSQLRDNLRLLLQKWPGAVS